jgi:NADH:ubiquinone oxidoreductase subunit K
VSPQLSHYLILSGILFLIGAAGFLMRRNALVALMSIELMLNAVNLTLVAFNRWQPAQQISSAATEAGQRRLDAARETARDEDHAAEQVEGPAGPDRETEVARHHAAAEAARAEAATVSHETQQMIPHHGQIFAFFVIAVAAAEAAVGLAIVLSLYRVRKSVRTDDADLLKG